jgi:hypothetical protein
MEQMVVIALSNVKIIFVDCPLHGLHMSVIPMPIYDPRLTNLTTGKFRLLSVLTASNSKASYLDEYKRMPLIFFHNTERF